MIRYNQTRTSESIPARLAAERRFHLIPFYHLLRLSELGREGIENSGSYHFADHIYVGEASGRGIAGRAFDRLLLSLPSARSFRNRFRHVIEHCVDAHEANHALRILSAPSGIPRDLIEVASRRPGGSFHAFDIDPTPLAIGRRMAETRGVAQRFEFIEADVFDEGAWPGSLDVITSTGLAEFLDEARLIRFYSLCHAALAPGGVLVTSATRRHRFSAFLMEQLAELRAFYREPHQLERILAAAGFSSWTIDRDRVGYQWLIVASR